MGDELFIFILLVLFHIVWIRLVSRHQKKFLGMEVATIEDLAFPIYYI